MKRTLSCQNSKKTKELKLLERAGSILKIYRSGKIPKIIKIIAVLENFEEFLWFTRPDRWSSQAILAIARLFSSKLNDIQTHRFYALILVPRIQEQLFQRKNLSAQLYNTLKLSSKNEKFFFASIITPICISSRCTNKEATLFASFISSHSFSNKHISCFLVILLKDKTFTIQKIVVLRAIISKKYNLSNRIVEYIIDFFLINKQHLKIESVRKCCCIFIKNYVKFLAVNEKRCLLKILF